jgi:hypothetical protein
MISIHPMGWSKAASKPGYPLVGFLLSTLFGASSCKNLGPETSMWPLVDTYEAPGGRASEVDVFGPILESSVDAEMETFALRPLFVSTARPREGTEDTKFVWPFGRSLTTPMESFVRVFPIYSDRTWLTAEGWQHDWFVLPILAGGTTPTRGSYFSFFPFAGNLKGQLGRDEINFILFPIYSDTRVGETKSVNVLWPIVSVSKGPGMHAVSVLPFYGYREKEGTHDRHYVLWPFVQWGHEKQDTDDPTSWTFVWPFYGVESSPTSESHTVLWPFFSWSSNQRTGYSAYDAPWPILKREKGKDIDRFRVWPLFGWNNSSELESTFVLWPFVWNRHEHTSWTTSHQFYVLPFVYSVDRQQAGDPNTSNYFKLWPLFYRDRSANGALDFQFLTLVPFRLEGFEDVYGFLWSLYHRTTRPDGSGREETWLRSFVHRWGPDFDEYRVPLLWSYRQDAAGHVNHSFLFGLVQYESDADGAGLRFFYLPRFPSW